MKHSMFFGHFVANRVDSGRLIAASAIVNMRVLWPKCPGPKVVILHGFHCAIYTTVRLSYDRIEWKGLLFAYTCSQLKRT